MADLLSEYDNPEIPTEKKGMFESLLSALDRPSNALQGLVIDGLEGASKGWGLEHNYDFEDMWRDSPQGERGWSDREGFLDHLSYIASVPFNLVVDPVNVVGAGLITKPYKFVKDGDKAAEEAKGMLSTSFPNYIKDFYKPSEISKAKADRLMEQRGLPREYFKSHPDFDVKDYEKLRDSLTAQYKAQELINWGALGGKNALNTFFSPSKRAIYRETGINKNMMESPLQSPTHSPQVELIHRTFGNRHIGEQAGRKGSTKELDVMMNRGFHSTYHVNKPGLYQELSGKYTKGAAWKSVTDQDFADIEKHLGVWKDGKGREFGVSPNDHIIIKRAQSSLSGDHWDDFQRAKIINDLAPAFHVSKTVPQNPKKLANYLKKEGIKLPNMKVQDDGIVFSFSKPGTSITEGGVNMWAKIKPDGKIIGVMSDEHNLFEKLPFMNRVVPNRVVAVTPPMVANIRTLKRKQTGATSKAKQGRNLNADWGNKKDRFLHLNVDPSQKYLDTERQVLMNRVLGAGMLSSNNSQE